jgi:hypothetical protein
MGSKGGSGPTESTVTQTNLPEYAEPFYRDLLTRVGYESAVPYTPYGDRRLEYFTPSEQEAMRRFQQLGVSGTPAELDAAGSIAAQVGGGNPYAAAMLESTRRGQEMPSYGYQSMVGQLQPYMSPYQQMVVNREKDEAMRQSEIMGQNIGLQAAGSGSLGGYREAIMQSERQRNLEDQMADIQTAGSQRAFEQAMAGFESDEARRAAAAQMNMEQARAAASMGQSAFGQLMSADQQRLAAAGLLGDFTMQRQQMEMERLRGMQAAGQIERELMQRGLDIGYSDFLRQQAYPKEQLSFYSSMLQGIPIAPGQVSQAYGITPSMTQQLLGSGIAGVGLYNAFGG